MIDFSNELNDQYLTVPDEDDLSTFVGQRESVELLKVSCDASKMRHSAMRHVLITGESGCGKTRLAYAVANEIKKGARAVCFDKTNKEGDITAILTNLNDGDVIVAEQIQRLNGDAQAVLAQAMNNFKIYITVGKGISANYIQLDLPVFTLIGVAENRVGLKKTLLEEFEYQVRMKPYSAEELIEIVRRVTYQKGIGCDMESLRLIGEAAKGVPREALRLFKRVCDYAMVNHEETVSENRTREVLETLRFHSFY